MWISCASYWSKVNGNLSLFIGKRNRRWLYVVDVDKEARCTEQSWYIFGRFNRCYAFFGNGCGKTRLIYIEINMQFNKTSGFYPHRIHKVNQMNKLQIIWNRKTKNARKIATKTATTTTTMKKSLPVTIIIKVRQVKINLEILIICLMTMIVNMQCSRLISDWQIKIPNLKMQWIYLIKLKNWITNIKLTILCILNGSNKTSFLKKNSICVDFLQKGLVINWNEVIFGKYIRRHGYKLVEAQKMALNEKNNFLRWI